ncbi:unnamed protein product [Ranitomeya imitator]|uniref:F-BAR domain-containing protein n=1 Tax=Ranitomeya imitator TaxID=111125 RepID=A0ABN9LKG8_9NEOB|nr:unnamed protein product [Ranitomeya imitator]
MKNGETHPHPVSQSDRLSHCQLRAALPFMEPVLLQPKSLSHPNYPEGVTDCSHLSYCRLSPILADNTSFHEGRKAQQHMETCWKQLESSKRRFERDCKEADRAQQYFERMDADINVTKADVEKARQQAQIRHQMADDSKGDYSSVLQKFNHEQQEHYHTHIPTIFQKLQDMEEKRIVRLGDSLKTYADIDRQVIPIIGKCLDGITKSADSINGKQDSQTVIESYKSGFEPPGDVDFEDFTQSIKRTVSDTSLTNSRADGKSDPKISSKSRGKLWPFIKKNKLMSLLTSPHQPPPPPPASASPSAVPNGPQSPKQQKEPLSHRLNDFMTSKPKIHCFRSLKRGVSRALVCPLYASSVPSSPATTNHSSLWPPAS